MHKVALTLCLADVNSLSLVHTFYAPRKISGEHIVAALSVRLSVSQSVRPSVRPSVRAIRVWPITLLFKVGFQNYFI